MTDKERRKLSAEIATEVMGWVWHKHEPEGFPSRWYYCWFDKNGKYIASKNFNPAESLDSCAMAERKMTELGLGSEYAYKVVLELHAYRDYTFAESMSLEQNISYELLTAPPAVRCKAMLEALRKVKK